MFYSVACGFFRSPKTVIPNKYPDSQIKDSVSSVNNVNSYKKIFLASETGNDIIASYDYFPYGKKIELAHTSEGAVTQTFTGKELDRYDEDMDIGADGEGWYYFGARYYDADIGMWVSCDPAVSSGHHTAIREMRSIQL